MRGLSWPKGLGPVVCFAAVLFSTALAAAQSKRVVVLEFTGPGSNPVRGHVLSALKARDDIELIPAKEAEAARQRLGVQWGSSEAYQRVGGELGASAFVEGSVSKVKKKWRANVRVRDASTGLPADDKSYTRGSLPQLKAIEKLFWRDLGPAIQGSSAPSAEEPALAASDPGAQEPSGRFAPLPDERQDASEQTAAPEDFERAGPSTKSARRPALLAWAGPRLMWRTLQYGDEDTQLNSYQNTPQSPALTVALGAQWFPGAHKRNDALSDLGLEADIDYALGLKSRQGGKEVKTTAYELSAGLIYRLPLDSFEPRFRVGYVRQVFDPAVASDVAMPGVAYGALRFGLGTGIFLVDWLSVDLNAAYLFVLNSGDIGQLPYAPDLSTGGFEIGLHLGAFITEAYGIRAGVDFRRYALDFGSSHPDGYLLPNDGSDHYVRLTLAFVYRMPGVAKAAR